MVRINGVTGMFFIKRPGDVNGKGMIPVFLAPVEHSAEAKQLIREGAESGYWQAYVPAALMPDSISRTSPYEIAGEIVMERVAWESIDNKSRKVKTTMINNAYIFVRSVKLVEGVSVPAAVAAVAADDQSGAFGDVPPASDLGKHGGRNKDK